MDATQRPDIKVLDDIKPADDDELAGVNIIRRSIEPEQSPGPLVCAKPA